MRKTLLFLFTLFMSASLAVFAVDRVEAAEVQFKDQDVYTLEDDVSDDLILSSNERVIVNGNIDGDLIVASGIVDVNGDVSGNLVAMGGNVRVRGDVAGMLIMFGGNLDQEGSVGGTLLAAGGNVFTAGEVAGDMFVTGGQVSAKNDVADDSYTVGGAVWLEGTVGDNLFTSGGEISLDADVGHDVLAGAGLLTVNSDSIGGDLVFYGEEEYLTVASSTDISGEQQVNTPEPVRKDYKWGAVAGTYASLGAFVSLLLWTVVSTIGLILLGYMFIRYAPVNAMLSVERLNSLDEAGKSFLFGLIAFPVGILLVILLAVSFVGWPLMVALLGLALVAYVVATPLVGMALGRVISDKYKWKYSYFKSMVLGVVLLQLLSIVPILGGLVSFVVVPMGVGALIRMKRGML